MGEKVKLCGLKEKRKNETENANTVDMNADPNRYLGSVWIQLILLKTENTVTK